MAVGRLIVLLGVLCAASPVLAAQSPSVLFPSTRPDQVPVSPGYRRPVLEPTLRTVAAAPSVAAFVLRGVDVEGFSLPGSVLRRAYAPWLGRTVGSAELKALAEAIAQAYAAHSDVAIYGVSIPAQSFRDGVARVATTEGFIQGARVVGPSAKHGNALLKRYLDRLVRERPLRRSTLERVSALIRDIAGLNATLSFVTGAQPGALVLVVSTQPRTAELGVGLNTRGTAYLGRTQADVDLALHGLLRQGDDTHLSFAFPTDIDRFRYYGLSHAQPLGASGASILVSAGYLQTRPDFTDLRGHALTLGVSATDPILRRNDQSLYLTAGVDGVDSDNALLGQAISDDHVRVARLAASYVLQTPRLFLLMNGSVNLGLNGLGAHVLSPQVSDITFKKYTVKLSANIAVRDDVVLRLDSTGQYSPDNLPGSEQLALGGDEFGRAYEAAVIEGDQGFAGSAELAWKLSRLVPAPLTGSEVYAVADGGETRRYARPAEPGALQQLASLGAGGRLAVTSRAVVQLEADRGLLNPVPTENHESWRANLAFKTLF